MNRPVVSSWWSEVQSIDDKGRNSKFVLKLNEYEEDNDEHTAPTIYWELRRILPIMHASTRGTHAIVNRYMADWKEGCRKNGMRWGEVFHVTAKSVAPGDIDELVSQVAHEYECTTSMLIIVLLDALDRRQKIAMTAKGVLVALIVALLEAHECELFVLERIPRPSDDEDDLDDDLCFGNVMAQALLLNYCSLVPPQNKLAEQLCILHTHHKQSGAAARMLEKLLAEVSDAIDRRGRWEETFKHNYLEDVQALVMKGNTNKRRRMDAGLQKALGVNVARDNDAGTGAFLRAHPSLYSASHGLRFNSKAVCSKVSAQWLSFAKTQHFSVAVDGVRCGAPGADSLVAPMYDVAREIGGWLPNVDNHLHITRLSLLSFFNFNACCRPSTNIFVRKHLFKI